MFAFSCHNSPSKQESIDWLVKVQSLDTKIEKKTFLDSIYLEYLHLRKESDAALSVYGLNSEIHLKKKKILQQNRDVQFKKVDAYLNTFGYPGIMEMGGMAAYAPYYITQSMPDLKSREKNFTYIYDAYLFGNITEDLFYNYISSLYYLKTDKNYLYDPNVETKKQVEDILALLDYN